MSCSLRCKKGCSPSLYWLQYQDPSSGLVKCPRFAVWDSPLRWQDHSSIPQGGQWCSRVQKTEGTFQTACMAKLRLTNECLHCWCTKLCQYAVSASHFHQLWIWPGNAQALTSSFLSSAPVTALRTKKMGFSPSPMALPFVKMDVCSANFLTPAFLAASINFITPCNTKASDLNCTLKPQVNFCSTSWWDQG